MAADRSAIGARSSHPWVPVPGLPGIKWAGFEQRWLEDWGDWLRREDLLPRTPFLISRPLNQVGYRHDHEAIQHSRFPRPPIVPVAPRQG